MENLTSYPDKNMSLKFLSSFIFWTMSGLTDPMSSWTSACILTSWSIFKAIFTLCLDSGLFISASRRSRELVKRLRSRCLALSLHSSRIALTSAWNSGSFFHLEIVSSATDSSPAICLPLLPIETRWVDKSWFSLSFVDIRDTSSQEGIG